MLSSSLTTKFCDHYKLKIAVILSVDGDYDEKLTEFLLKHSKFRRPVLSIKDNVTVVFGVTLNQIIDVVCPSVHRKSRACVQSVTRFKTSQTETIT